MEWNQTTAYKLHYESNENKNWFYCLRQGYMKVYYYPKMTCYIIDGFIIGKMYRGYINNSYTFMSYTFMIDGYDQEVDTNSFVTEQTWIEAKMKTYKIYTRNKICNSK
jgi:hypothetical protein